MASSSSNVHKIDLSPLNNTTTKVKKINVSPPMTTAAAAAAIQPPLVRQQDANAVKNAIHIRSNSFPFRFTTASSPTSGGRRIAVAASRSTKEEANSKADDSAPSEDDVSFLLKLGAGSFAGAAAIKYGSILVPEITRPNIIQALIMISTPVIVAVFILINQSRVER